MPNKSLALSTGFLCLLMLSNVNRGLAQALPIDISEPRDSLADLFVRVEQILAHEHPNLFDQPMSVDKVLYELRRLGLPIVLDQSAIDDSVDRRQLLRFPLPHEPLGARLRHSLKQHNATLTIKDGLIRIISRDDAETDPQYLITLVYDVTTLGGSPRKLIETIEFSVESESWFVAGSGLGTVQAIRVGKRNLLVVTQTYDIHRQLHQLLSDLHRAGGIKANRTHSAAHKRGTGKPVVVPETRTSNHNVIRVTTSPTEPSSQRDKKRGGGGGVF